jgi:hypothetical protein
MALAWNVMLAVAAGLTVVKLHIFWTGVPLPSAADAVTVYVRP